MLAERVAVRVWSWPVSAPVTLVIAVASALLDLGEDHVDDRIDLAEDLRLDRGNRVLDRGLDCCLEVRRPGSSGSPGRVQRRDDAGAKIADIGWVCRS